QRWRRAFRRGMQRLGPGSGRARALAQTSLAPRGDERAAPRSAGLRSRARLRVSTADHDGGSAAGDTVKRLAIYAHWDAQDEVKPYVEFYLRRLREECDRIIFVSTSKLPETEMSKVRPFCVDVRLRENVGYDFVMWRDVIADLTLDEGDELVLTNSSV